MTRLISFCWASAWVILGAWVPRASARELSPAESATRRQLIADAEAAHDAGDHTKALDLGQHAGSIEMTTSLRYFLAREQEEVGAIADGYANAQQCAIEVEHDPKLRNRDVLLQECRKIESRLSTRIGHLLLEMPDRPTALKIRIAGQDISSAIVGTPYVVTPGAVVVDATAPGRLPFHTVASVPEGGTVSISVVLPVRRTFVLEKKCPPGSELRNQECVKFSTAVASPPVKPILSTTPPDPDSEVRTAPIRTTETADKRANATTETSSLWKTAYDPYIAAAGGAILVGGTIAYLISESTFSSIEGACNVAPQQDCTMSRYNDSVSKIQTLDRVAHVSWAVGLALIVGGGLHYSLSSPQKQIDLAVDPHDHTVALAMTF